tara:strand:+ start:579 stop:1535 length:957 start_codon:yes stop_codon:yes gene_type:complete
LKAIEINNLTKKYQDFYALKNLDLTINKGEIFGFLGPNGAGKSTLVRIISTLTQPTSGDAKVLNLSINKHKKEIRKLIGVALQDSSLDPLQTGEELLTFHSNLNNINKFEIKTKVNRILKMLDLYESKDKLVKTYSGGMRRKLDIASSLLHEPEILFLDEPTTGLDPVSRQKIWSEIKRLKEEQGKTIFLTTQYLDEADKLADRLAIINKGELVGLGTPEELKSMVSGDVVEIGVSNLSKTLKIFNAIHIIKQIKANTASKTINCVIKKASVNIPDIINKLSESNIQITKLNISPANLDDVFLKITGNNIKLEETSNE